MFTTCAEKRVECKKDVTVVTACKQVATVLTECKKVMTVFTLDCLIWKATQSSGTTPHSRIASARAMFTTCHARVLERVAKNQFFPGSCGCPKSLPPLKAFLKRSTHPSLWRGVPTRA
jgi:hypothetical protein